MIEYVISMKRKIYSIEKEDSKLLLLFCFFQENYKLLTDIMNYSFLQNLHENYLNSLPNYRQGL